MTNNPTPISNISLDQALTGSNQSRDEQVRKIFKEYGADDKQLESKRYQEAMQIAAKIDDPSQLRGLFEVAKGLRNAGERLYKEGGDKLTPVSYKMPRGSNVNMSSRNTRSDEGISFVDADDVTVVASNQASSNNFLWAPQDEALYKTGMQRGGLIGTSMKIAGVQSAQNTIEFMRAMKLMNDQFWDEDGMPQNKGMLHDKTIQHLIDIGQVRTDANGNPIEEDLEFYRNIPKFDLKTYLDKKQLLKLMEIILEMIFEQKSEYLAAILDSIKQSVSLASSGGGSYA